MKILLIILGLSISAFSALLEQNLQKDGFNIHLYSKKPLVVGSNEIFVKITKNKTSANVQTKIKFFMPEMPGMPFMQSQAKGIKTNENFKFEINFSMGGTWQYRLKIRDENKKIVKIKGSVNL